MSNDRWLAEPVLALYIRFAFWLIYTWPTESLSPVEVSVTPRAAVGPIDLKIRVVIERHADNLWLYIEWKSERLDGNSEIRLDGDSPCEFVRDVPQRTGFAPKGGGPDSRGSFVGCQSAVPL